jgi:hypothetical protein
MTSRHALLPAVTAAVVLVLAMVFPFAGCGLPLQGLPNDTDAGSPCNADGQCKGTNPCMIDSCVAGTCNHAAQPDGPAASASQTAFDCKVIQCVKGSPEQQNDDADIQADAEDCTIDQCNAGEAFHTAKPDNTPCTMGGDGICVGGKCQILCANDKACDDMNPCTTDTCDVTQGLCTFTPLNGVETPGFVQIPADCNVQVCVDGVSMKSPDDSDLPKTTTPCDQEICTGGVPSNPPLPDTVTCGVNKDQICDGSGNCVECNTPIACPGTDDDCQVRSCTGHVCGITYLPAGTPRLPSFQKLGDCKVVVCDGAGNTAMADKNDDTDLPVDGNLCTIDTCTGGAPSHPNAMAGTNCGVNGACDANGNCGCANNLGCVAPDTCGGSPASTPFICGCTPKTCAQLGKTCGTIGDGCYSTQNCDDGFKQGTETDIDCGGGAAGTCGDTCGSGKQCNVDTDCGSGHCADGVCCNTACTGTCLACSAAKKGGGADGVCGSIAFGLQDANATTTCIGNNACDGTNTCKKLDGQACMAGQCLNGNCIDGVCCNSPCNGSCLACSAAKKGGGVDGVCGNVPVNQQDSVGTTPCTGNNACDGAGACKSKIGQGCAGNAACANGQCVDSICCGVPSCGACQSCALGPVGTCGFIPSGMPDNVPASTCVSPSACDGAGNCKSGVGQPCAGNTNCANNQCVDGICCSTACAGTCQACSAAKTGGTDGTCSNITANQQDTSATTPCVGTSVCDGNGACKAGIGQPCPGGNGNCANAQCVDGVCCSTACAGTCQACAAAKTGGADGTCSNVTASQQDASATTPCIGTNACDGAGACKAAVGQPCPGGNASCANGQCADGFCCNTACTGTCQACAAAKTGGVDGTCSNILVNQPDTSATVTCMTPNACDSGGNCKLALGENCPGGNSTCSSNFCADGVCCNVACGMAASCMSCNQVGNVGTCSPVMGADDPDSCLPTLTNTCSAAGACLLRNGTPCTAGPQCASGNCTLLTCQ